MKKTFTTLFLALLFSVPQMQAQVVFFQEDFETDGTGSRYTAANQFASVDQASYVNDYWGRVQGNQIDGAMTRGRYADGSTPFILVTGLGANSNTPAQQTGDYTGYSGNFYFAGEDLDDAGGNIETIGTPGGGATKSVLFTGIDISGHTSITFRGLFAAGTTRGLNNSEYDSADHIIVYYEVDAGGEMPGVCFHNQQSPPGDTANEPLAHDPECDGSSNNLVPGAVLDNTLAEFSFIIPDGTSLNLRVEVAMNSGSEEVAFDNLRLLGSPALPVELIDFHAVSDEAGVLLTWQTATETNNAGFEVERFTPATGWQPLHFTEGAGTTLEPQRYSYRAANLAPGRHRFRLKQLDFDGSFAYSPEVEAVVAVPGVFVRTAAYPNPFNPSTQFSLAVSRAQRVEVAVFDMMGRRVSTLYTGMLPAHEQHLLRFEAGGLPSGPYLIRVVGEQFRATQSVTLVK